MTLNNKKDAECLGDLIARIFFILSIFAGLITGDMFGGLYWLLVMILINIIGFILAGIIIWKHV